MAPSKVNVPSDRPATLTRAALLDCVTGLVTVRFTLPPLTLMGAPLVPVNVSWLAPRFTEPATLTSDTMLVPPVAKVESSTTSAVPLLSDSAAPVTPVLTATSRMVSVPPDVPPIAVPVTVPTPLFPPTRKPRKVLLPALIVMPLDGLVMVDDGAAESSTGTPHCSMAA